MKKQNAPHVKDLVKFFSTVNTKVGKPDSSCTSPPIASPNSIFEFKIRGSTPTFHGRTAQITSLHNAIQINKSSGHNLTVLTQSVDVNPLGGVGKSELVRKYIEDYRNDYNHVIWIDAKDSPTLRKEFHELATQLECLESTDQFPLPDPELVSSVYSSLENSTCLIIFDNVSSLDLTEFLPPEDLRGKPLVLLITSKNLNWSQEPLALEGLTIEEGAALLIRELTLEPSEEPLTKVFIELCDGLPLALQIAIPLIDIIPEGQEGNSNFLQNFVESFAVEQENYLSRRLPESVTNITTSVLLQIAEKEILEEEHGQLAIQISEILAFLSSITHKRVLISLFPAVEMNMLDSALNLLEKYGIIFQGDSHVEIHPHLQTIIEEKIQIRDNKTNTKNSMLEQITAHLQSASFQGSEQQLKREFLHTGLCALNHIKFINFQTQLHLDFSEYLGKELARFDFRESYRIFQESLDFRIEMMSSSQTIPSDKPPSGTDTTVTTPEIQVFQRCKKFLKEILENEEDPLPKKLAANQILGHILNIQGKCDKALEIFQQVSKIQKKFWGSEHVEYLTTQNTIGTLLFDLNQFEEAFEVYSSVYEAFKGTYGVEYPLTITVESNISVVLHRLGKYYDAYESYENVLEKQERIFGKQDPGYLRTKNNMAVILELQGSHDEALEIFLAVLQQQLETLGTSHADTLASGHNIASILDTQGNSDEALKIYQDVYEGRKNLLGEKHVDTLSTYHNLALLLDKTKSYSEAIPIYKQVHTARAEILGEDHRDTLNSLYNMAIALENNKNYDEAYQTYNKVYSIFCKKLGPEHPASFYCLHNIALVLESMGKYQESLELYGNIYEGQRKIFGHSHPDTLRTRFDMALVLEYQNNYKEAFDIFSDVYASRQSTLGEDHPDTLTTHHKMASILESLHRYEEASQIYSDVLEKQMQVLGREHVDTVATVHNKTILEFQQKNYSEAFEMYKKVYEIRRKALGPVHPETLSTQHNIGLVLTAMQNFPEAYAIFEEVYENRKDILGPEHVDTLRTRQNLANVLKKLNRLSESFEILTQVYGSRKKILGDQHPETINTKNKIKAI